MTKVSVNALAATLAAALAASALLVAALVIQHLRHGWPFSLHHLAPMVAPQGLAAQTAAHAAHARAPVQIDAGQVGRAGVILAKAQVEAITRPLRVTATVVPDEARIAHVHTRVSGWLEALYASTTGEQVKAGQPLAGIFSQELYASQAEYLSARRAAGNGPKSAIVGGARARLLVLGMSDAEISAIERSGKPQRLVTLTAPRKGVLLRRGAAVGSAVDPSTEIVAVADLSRVWVIAEVPESDAAAVQLGSLAQLEVPGVAHSPRAARVEFVAPTLSERTRTLKVRFSVDNASGLLRPGTFVTAQFAATPREAVTVPRDAVVDTGQRQHVFVATAPDRFEPRTVTLGSRLAERVEIASGLAAGEEVVAAGVFLIDSESRLRASSQGAADSKPAHAGH
jgi:Cu(I)/Ag(I) efflux system membrane fusion protein